MINEVWTEGNKTKHEHEQHEVSNVTKSKVSFPFQAMILIHRKRNKNLFVFQCRTYLKFNLRIG